MDLAPDGRTHWHLSDMYIGNSCCMDEPASQTTRFSRLGPDSRISPPEWRVCSQIFVEGRRIRSLIAELRAQIATTIDPSPRAALELYVETLERAAALGDVAADAMVANPSRRA
jgi:hypothetical protein